MLKFRVTADVGYVSGHLRYGHLEGVVEAESENKLKKMMKSPGFDDLLDLVVDDYRVDDYGDVGEYEVVKVDD